MKNVLAGIGVVGAFGAMAAVVIGLLLVSPFVFMICWNYVAPVFWKGAPDLTFIQSLAVVVAARIALKPNARIVNKTE